MAILGIDLGSTNSLAAVWRNGKSALIPNSYGAYLTPSVVSIDEDGSTFVGQSAKERLISHPALSAASFKGAMGTNTPFFLGENVFSAEDLSALLLQSLRQDAQAYLGEPVTEAVIAVPAYFNDVQRAAVKRAAELAGIHVKKLINEPAAAALACRMEDPECDKTYLIVDFGGETLDVSLVECYGNVVEIAAIAGDSHLGGGDFNRAIADYFCMRNEIALPPLPKNLPVILHTQAEQCKKVLSSRDRALMILDTVQQTYSMTLDRGLLVEILTPLLERLLPPIRRVLKESGTNLSAVDEIILVGGSCKMPIVREYLSYGMGRPVRALSPDRMTALGAGVCAGVLEHKLDIPNLVLKDICPFTLGVAILNQDNPDDPLMSPLIERNSVLPCSISDRFYTISDQETMLRVKIFRGENLLCSQNLELGEVTIQVPPAPQGQESVEVRFTYDIDGILEVAVTNDTSGITKKGVLVGRGTGITDEEAQKRLQELESLKVHPRDQEENRAIIARGHRLFAETLGFARKMVLQNLSWFSGVLETQDIRKIKHARQSLTEMFDQLEQGY